MLDALQLRAEVADRVPHILHLHEQQEERKDASQEAAKHPPKISDDPPAWQFAVGPIVVMHARLQAIGRLREAVRELRRELHRVVLTDSMLDDRRREKAARDAPPHIVPCGD